MATTLTRTRPLATTAILLLALMAVFTPAIKAQDSSSSSDVDCCLNTCTGDWECNDDCLCEKVE